MYVLTEQELCIMKRNFQVSEKVSRYDTVPYSLFRTAHSSFYTVTTGKGMYDVLIQREFVGKR